MSSGSPQIREMTSTIDTSLPRKRPRIKVELDERPSTSDLRHCQRHEKLYIANGGVVLLCDTTIFKVYDDLLFHHSDLFRGMISPPAGEVETYDGCPLIRLEDAAQDVEHFLCALLYSDFLDPDVTPPFPTLSGILRVAFKYGAVQLRKLMTRYLEFGYVTSFAQLKKTSRLGSDIFPDPRPHPNAVLKLILECDVQNSLPFAYWDTCSRGLEPIFSDEPGAVLPPAVVKTAVMGTMALMTLQASHAKNSFHSFASNCKCPVKIRDPSTLESQRNTSFPSNNPDIRADVFKNVTEDLMFEFCSRCRRLWAHMDEKRQQDIWKKLPTCFNLPSWEDLAGGEAEESPLNISVADTTVSS